MEYMLETIGSGDVLWSLFNGIAALLRPNGGSLIRFFITLGTAMGAVGALWYTVFQNTWKPALKWFVTSQVIILGLLAPVANVHIKDELTGFNRTVDNVPFALAFTASTFSSIGTGITRTLETVFQPAPSYVGGSGFVPQSGDQLLYSQTGFMFGAHVMAQMKGVQLTNDDMMDNLKEFVNQCVVYDALIGRKYTLHDLKRSDNLWQLVSTKASQLRGFAWRDVLRDTNGGFQDANPTTIITCKEGAKRIDDMWRETRTSLVSRFHDRLSETCGLNTQNTKSLSHAIEMNLPGALTKLMHNGKDAAEHLKQQVMISAILKANEGKTLELGGSPNLDVRRAYLQQRTMFETIGETIAYNLPSFKNTVEALIYALFIFVMFGAMLPSGVKILKFYMKLLLWIQLWAPLFTILNFIRTESLAAKTASALGTDSGVTIANMVGLMNMALDMSASAGYMSVFIPPLSWALIELGGYSFVSIASGMLGVSQSAATSTAMEKIQGNYSAGNVTLEGTQAYNSNMLKHDTSASYTGSHFAMNEGITAKTVMADGETLLNRVESRIPVTVSMQDAREDVLRDAQTTADLLQRSYGESASDSKRFAASNFHEFGKLASQERASGVQWNDQQTASVLHEAADSYDKVKDISHQFGVNEDIINQKAMEIHGGFGASGSGRVDPKSLAKTLLSCINVGASAHKTETAQALAQAAAHEIIRFSESDSFRHAMSHMDQVDKIKSFNMHDQRLNQLAQNVSMSLEESRSYEHQSNKAREASESIQQERARNQTQGVRVDANFTEDFVKEMGADHLKDMSIREMQVKANQFAQKKIEPYQQRIVSTFDIPALKKGLDTSYQQHTLHRDEQDVTKAYGAQKKSIIQNAAQAGVRSEAKLDHAPQDTAEDMISTNQSAVMLRGGLNRNKVQAQQEVIDTYFKKHFNEELGYLRQETTALNMLDATRKRGNGD